MALMENAYKIWSAHFFVCVIFLVKGRKVLLSRFQQLFRHVHDGEVRSMLRHIVWCGNKVHGSSLDAPPQRFLKKELVRRSSTKLDFFYSLNCRIPTTQCETNELALDMCLRSNTCTHSSKGNHTL